ncbi:MAG: hypothetical protein H8D22_07535 [Candidatus Cloacimonetes bacterium]|nr:hypothetical protein [Candidatus Cloacimonadota bacterium]
MHTPEILIIFDYFPSCDVINHLGDSNPDPCEIPVKYIKMRFNPCVITDKRDYTGQAG